MRKAITPKRAMTSGAIAMAIHLTTLNIRYAGVIDSKELKGSTLEQLPVA
jgi:hypothetical protein